MEEEHGHTRRKPPTPGSGKQQKETAKNMDNERIAAREIEIDREREMKEETKRLN